MTKKIKELTDFELLSIGRSVCIAEKCSVSCPFATKNLHCYLLQKTSKQPKKDIDFSEVLERKIEFVEE